MLMKKTFDRKPSYAYLLFGTLPGITGIILLFIITAMGFASLAKV